MKKHEVTRMIFRRNSEYSPDERLESFLDNFITPSVSLISIQQIDIEYASKGKRDTYVVWVEYLITTQRESS